MWLLRPTLLVLVLVTVACSARYEDGYRGGNKRSRYASESEEDDSDEQHEHVQGYDERRYKYESSESDEKSSEEGHHDFVHFKKRRLQHYANHIEDEDDGFFDDVKYNRVPGSHLEHRDRDRDYKQEKSRGYQDRRDRERYPEPARPYSDQYQARQYYPERQMGAQEAVYSWKQDRERFPPLPPLVIPPPEKPHKNFAPGAGRDPPPPTEAARMARYIVHNTDWATMATISTMPKIKGYPFSNTVSMSDGPIDASSGVPYLYLTPLEMSTHDLSVDRRCSLTMTLAETEYCKRQSFDPEDPRCARVTLSGEMWKLKNGTQAAKKAEEALFPRHPIMKTWPKDHGFFFATLKIDQIVLLDYFGGPKYISVKDYFRANPGS